MNLLGQPLGNGGFTHTGIAHEYGIVLAASAEDLQRALQLGLPTNQRIQKPFGGFLHQVDGIGFKWIRRFFFLLAVTDFARVTDTGL